MPNNRQKNANAVNHFYQAIARGDVASARKVLHQELEWTTSEPSGLWFGGTYHGACAVMNEVILAAYRWIADFRAEMERFLVSGEHVVAIGRFRGRTKTTGEELNAPTTHVWTFRNGKAVRVHTYLSIMHRPFGSKPQTPQHGPIFTLPRKVQPSAGNGVRLSSGAASRLRPGALSLLASRRVSSLLRSRTGTPRRGLPLPCVNLANWLLEGGGYANWASGPRGVEEYFADVRKCAKLLC